MASAEPGAGNIPLHLDGRDHELVPTLHACMAIDKIAGGMNAAVQRCQMLHLDTLCQIVTAGLGLNPNQARMVPEAIYKTGMAVVAARCIDFCNVIINGGRPLDEEEGGDAAPDPLSPASL